MFGIAKDRLTKNLETLRASICCYMGPRCDCKYDIVTDHRRGEHTGCPEVRLATKLIEALTDEEYSDLCKRSGVSIW